MIYNFGSLNIDYVYEIQAIACPGQTVSANTRKTFPGGKGLNQSIAMARAGAAVTHLGYYGKQEAKFLVDLLSEAGVQTHLLKGVDATNGHAVIQVENSGENAIVVFGGTNQMVDSAYVKEVADIIREGDWVLFQNEMSCVAEMMTEVYRKGGKIILNPSPFNETIKTFPLDKVTLFFVNHAEGKALTNQETPEAICEAFGGMYPQSAMILTMGEKGALYFDGNRTVRQSAHKAKVVLDTTGAGDTFTGYFVAGLSQGLSEAQALKRAAIAAALAVEKMGAASSIPFLKAVIDIENE